MRAVGQALSLRFQADADLNPAIGRGLRRREPSLDFRSASGVIPDHTPDPEVLRIAAEARRGRLFRGTAPHSYLNAISGSIAVAFRAGT